MAWEDLIKQQLSTAAYADLSNYDPNTNTYHIKKYTKPKYDIGACYLVKISANVVNQTNSVLAANWNNGKAPKYPYYKIYVGKSMPAYKLIYVDGLMFDYEHQTDGTEMFSGWLPVDELTQLAKI